MKQKEIFKKGICIITLSLMTTSLSGCRLANNSKENKQVTSDEQVGSEDVWVGTFYSPYNFFERELELSVEDLMNIAFEDSEIEFESEVPKSDRIYATEKVVKNENGNNETRVVFENYFGVGLFFYEIEDELYCSVDRDGDSDRDRVYDVKWDIETTEDVVERSISGKVYVNKSSLIYDDNKNNGKPGLYTYSVFQEITGKIYMTPGDTNIGTINGIKTKLEVENKKVLNKDVESIKCSSEIESFLESAADNCIIREMDGDHSEINNIQLDLSNCPNQIDINEKTQYLVVEQYKDGELKDKTIKELIFADEEDAKFLEFLTGSEDEYFLKRAKVELMKN